MIKKYMPKMNPHLMNYIYKDLTKTLENKIEESREYISKIREKQKNEKNVVNKVVNDSKIKETKENIKALAKLSKNIYDINFSSAAESEIPDELDKNLESIAQYLTKEEISELENKVNSCLEKSRTEPIERSKRLYKESEKLIKEAKLEGNYVDIDRLHFSTYKYAGKMDYTIPQAVEDIYYYSIYKNSERYEIKINTEKELTEVLSDNMRMLNSVQGHAGKFDTKDKNTREILKNIEMIKHYMGVKEKSEAIRDRVSEIKAQLNVETKKTDSINYTELMEFLDAMDKNNLKSLQVAEKFLAKYDLKEIETKLYEIKEEEKTKDTTKLYQRITEDLWKAEEEGNTEKANQLKEDLKRLGRDMTQEQKKDAKQAAKFDYTDKKIEESKPKTNEEEKKEDKKVEKVEKEEKAIDEKTEEKSETGLQKQKISIIDKIKDLLNKRKNLKMEIEKEQGKNNTKEDNVIE